MVDAVIGFFISFVSGVLDIVAQVLAAVVLRSVQRAWENPSVGASITALFAVSLVWHAMHLKRVGLIASFSVGAIVGATWRECGRLRRTIWLGLIGGFPIACVMVAIDRPTGNTRWNACAVVLGWVIAVFFPQDLFWRGQPGGLLWQKTGGRSVREWLRHSAARDAIESSVRRTIDPRTQVSGVHEVSKGRWDARVLVTEKDSPGDVEDRINDQTLGSTLTRVAPEKGFSETVQDVVVQSVPGEGVGVQRVSVMTGDEDPLRPVSYWPMPTGVQPGTFDKLVVGRYVNGDPVLINVPGKGGGHLLIAGESGSGKTTLEDAIIGQLAMRPNMAIVASDPKYVGLVKWLPRLTTLTQGESTAVPLLESLVDLLQDRAEMMAGKLEDDWDLRNGPWITVVFDEAGVLGLGRLTTPSAQALYRLLSMGRAIGIGVVLAMHRPSTAKLAGDLRDLFPVCIGLAMGSRDGAVMTFGPDDTPPAWDISEEDKGYGYAKVGRRSRKMRVHLSPVVPVELAQATAGLRIPAGAGEFEHWPHRIADPRRERKQRFANFLAQPQPQLKQRMGSAQLDD